MSAQTKAKQEWSLASVALVDAYTDFVLSRQAMNCTPATLEFYRYTAGVFLAWAEEQGNTSPEQITARYIRQFLAELIANGKKDTTVHANARAIRTLVRFWHSEGYIPELVRFEMPKLARKRLPVLTTDELKKVVSACNVRDKAIVLFMADSGIRRKETVELNWGDINLMNGLVRVRQGKGRKDRSAAVGATVRRALLKYRKTVPHDDNMPLFQTRTKERFTGSGLLRIFSRLSKQTGIRGLSPHAMRRTFVILSLRSGMGELYLQGLLGHTSLAMVEHYAQMIDDDLLQAHRAHSPIDNL